ncbi:MAG: type I glyceraldehyde-3-phosphate dehydrogenase [Candidatus Kerfeldbacteria bacterium CG15_BIG_FIL_POST_REV_8_21_14_020_45_12]|uniref:Glyceraldehyde-3-phosphate dehydrogenase n=1 Tax=Candidatus Kerfeldbacteria bacterium CG15_BIG_FIL_POST_REV_8_21_14_020_45_12 TaxID=2014247 RepID=A0A2M7H3V0_9BACT|nr:MAG: type I glyceraldehyde-3-phosphate dehydrogenase [Candidatus Kerfeldbacteria bacterium CG15_BIG_FIL_POST_REV_8_21_14_020_45_12]PJA94025.1 MAG: type I glyceraldehyde-3-phosphate dehydrogenase [Candidatus Kerfeldbacteria bacterium CG_4_9_14_3_um_filter_45_8]
MAKTRIAINGFGRIGKMAFKIALEEHGDNVEIVGINDLGPAEQAVQGLKYDSVYPSFDHDIDFGDDFISVDGVKVPKYAEMEPEKLPWKDLKVDVVLECTGVFTSKEGASKHLTAGAKTVIISAPAKGDDPVGTFVMGVNHDEHDAAKDPVLSNASCTTNCIAPVMQVLHDEFGVEKAMMSTIHGYTADQRLVDGVHKDPRRARAAAINTIPTSTGAAVATAETIPELVGIFDGMAFRVPVPVGSVSDITAVLKKDVTVEEVNAALSKAADSERYAGVLGVTTDPIVSSDIIGNKLSSLVDLPLTMVVGGNMVKVVAWYDNEYGYSNRLVEQAVEVGKDL